LNDQKHLDMKFEVPALRNYINNGDQCYMEEQYSAIGSGT